MTRAYVPLLLVLAAIWGASYLFIKVAVRHLEPAVMTSARMLIAAPLLIGFLAVRGGPRTALSQVAGAWRPGLVYGVINGRVAVHAHCVGRAAHRLRGGRHRERVSADLRRHPRDLVQAQRALDRPPARGHRSRAGRVGVLAGVHPEGGWWAVAGTLAVVAASLSYAAGGLYGQHAVGRVAGPVMAASGLLYGGLVLLPVALVQLPGHAPGWNAIGSVLALSVGGTALAQLFRMLRLFGAARLSLVTYLLPATALIYGALILDEPLRASALAGLALILGGIALGSGVWRRSRRPVVEPAP